jgi:hypothetical protein
VFDSEIMSPRDWEMVGCDPDDMKRADFRVAAAVEELLDGGPLWLPLCGSARALLRTGVLIPTWRSAAIQRRVADGIHVAKQRFEVWEHARIKEAARTEVEVEEQE